MKLDYNINKTTIIKKIECHYSCMYIHYALSFCFNEFKAFFSFVLDELDSFFLSNIWSARFVWSIATPPFFYSSKGSIDIFYESLLEQSNCWLDSIA